MFWFFHEDSAEIIANFERMSCFYGMNDQRHTFKSSFHPAPFLEVLAILNLQHAVSRI